jgi:hypothetical protein
MSTQQAKKRARELTMGCWWPSRAFPMLQADWPNIFAELECLAEQAVEHRGDHAEASAIRAVRSALEGAVAA